MDCGSKWWMRGLVVGSGLALLAGCSSTPPSQEVSIPTVTAAEIQAQHVPGDYIDYRVSTWASFAKKDTWVSRMILTDVTPDGYRVKWVNPKSMKLAETLILDESFNTKERRNAKGIVQEEDTPANILMRFPLKIGDGDHASYHRRLPFAQQGNYFENNTVSWQAERTGTYTFPDGKPVPVIVVSYSGAVAWGDVRGNGHQTSVFSGELWIAPTLGFIVKKTHEAKSGALVSQGISWEALAHGKMPPAFGPEASTSP